LFAFEYITIHGAQDVILGSHEHSYICTVGESFKLSLSAYLITLITYEHFNPFHISSLETLASYAIFADGNFIEYHHLEDV
jgi:hypothetical protein